MRSMPGKTLYDKIWESHLVADQDGESIFYIDLHLIHEVTTPQAFAGLRATKRRVRRPDRTSWARRGAVSKPSASLRSAVSK